MVEARGWTYRRCWVASPWGRRQLVALALLRLRIVAVAAVAALDRMTVAALRAEDAFRSAGRVLEKRR